MATNDIKSKLQAKGATVIDGKSANIVADNIEAFKALLSAPELRNRVAELFPDAFADGELQIDALLQDMGHYADNVEDHESYPISWRGKAEAQKRAQSMTTATLRPCPEESVGKDGTRGAFDSQNLYIEGDNLEVLKVLERAYAGQIKMIYIDPPYNTGNDFIYNDKYADGIKTYLEYTSQIDDKGNAKSTKTETSGASHSKWLSMMYPRLEYAKRLLKNDGVIFISIDDNEYANLKRLCDNVFGEKCFVTTIHCQMSTTQGMKVKAAQDGNIVKNAEYLLCYSKDGHKNIAVRPLYDLRPEYDEHYSLYLKEDGSIGSILELYNYKFPNDCANKSPYKLKDAFRISEEFSNIVRNNLSKIVRTDKVSQYNNIELKQGFYTKSTIGNKDYILTLDNNGNVKQLLKLADSWGQTDGFYKQEGLRKIRGDWWDGFYIDMGNVSKEGDIKFNNGKKPVRLIYQLIKLICNNSETVLDFFSGSATTAHALLKYNDEYSSNLKHIMVQIPDTIELSNESQQDGFKNIAEIGKERIRRAGAQIIEDAKKAGKDLSNMDIGFKVFKLDSSNLKKWDDKPADSAQEAANRLFGAQDMMVPGRSKLDVVYEYMLKYGLTLDWLVDCVKVAGKDVYVVAGGMFMVCLDHDLNKSWAEELVKLKNKLEPADWRVLVADESFGNNTETRDNNAQNIFHTLCDAGLAPVNFIIA